MIYFFEWNQMKKYFNLKGAFHIGARAKVGFLSEEGGMCEKENDQNP